MSTTFGFTRSRPNSSTIPGKNSNPTTNPSDPYIDRLIGISNITAHITDWETGILTAQSFISTKTGEEVIKFLESRLGPVPTRELERIKGKKQEFERMGRVEVAAQLTVLVWRVQDVLTGAERVRQGGEAKGLRQGG
jgi:hypothetical protein